MVLSKRLFYRKPPDHLLEIAERVYVFDCCFSTDIFDGEGYMDGIVVQMLEQFSEVSIMVFNFGEGDKSSQLYNVCTQFKITFMGYPVQYEQCALLPLEMINQFLQSCDNWLSTKGHQNVLLMHCERGGWPLLAFMLAGLLLYRKQFTGEQKILEMMYKQASSELLFLFPVNSQPSQLRYLHYISLKALSDNWHMPATLVRIDSIILRFLPVLGGNVCKPVVRVYGKDPSVSDTGHSKLLLSTAKDTMCPQHYAQADCDLVKIDIHCSVKGDVVIECVHLDDNQVNEEMMFRAMFHTSYLRSNFLSLARDEMDILWDAKDKFPKDFKAEVLFMDADSCVHVQTTEMSRECSKENGSASPEEFSRVDGKIIMSTGSSITNDSTGAEGSRKEVWTERVEHRTFQTSTSENLNQRLPLKVHPPGPHAVEFKGEDILNEKEDKGKCITIDQWDIETDPSSAIVDMKRNKKSKEVVKETSEKSEVTRNTLRVKLGNTASKLELNVQEQKENSEVGGRKNDKVLTPKLRKPPTFFTKAVVATAGGKQKGKQQEPSVTLAKSPTNEKPTVSRWIPSNKGSYTNSMHVAYPPKRAISIPPSLAVTVPKKTNFLRKGGGAKKSASHTDLTRVRVSNGSLDSPTARFISTPPSPLPQEEPTRMAVKARRALMQKPSTPRSPLVSPSSAFRLGVRSLQSRETSPSTEDTEDSCSPRVPLLKQPPTKPRPSSTSLQLTESSYCASPPPTSSSPLFHNGAAKQENLTNSLQSPSSTSPSPLDEEKDVRQVSSPPKPPVAPLSNDPSIPPPPPLPTTTATALERNNFGVSKATPTPPLHGMPPDCSRTPTADLLTHEMAPPAIALPLEKSLTSGVPAQSPTRSNVALPPTLREAPPGPSLPLSMSGVPPPPPPPFVMRASGPLHLSAGRVPSTVKSTVTLPSPHPIYAECLPVSPLSNTVPPPPPVPMGRIPPPPLHPMSRKLAVNGEGQPSLANMSGVPPPPPHPMNGVPPPPPHPMNGVPPPPPRPMSGVQPHTSPIMNGGPPPPPNLFSVGVPPPPPSLHGAAPPPPMGVKGLSFGRGSSISRAISVNKSSLKPLHWSKVTRALKGSLWEELQTNGETHIAQEFDVSEIETLFSAVTQKANKGADKRKSNAPKAEILTLIDLRRANNTEIMLSKVKMPLPDILMAILALDDSVLDIDQVENLIKFCPTKEEMDLLKAYTGDTEKLGKCEQYFLELMKVPRVESKLRVFAFKIQFGTQTYDFRQCLNTVNAACEEVRNSHKLKEIMKRILFLGNTLNNGTARGSAVGFKLESLLKLYDTRSSNSKMTLMHYLCKVIASKSPTLIDFYNDLGNLEAASKIQLKSLAEEMQAIIKGLEKVKVELGASENDGPVSDTFRKTLTGFVGRAESEVASVTELYSTVGQNANALALYFGEDPARYPFEQVCATIVNFVRLFQKAHEENLKEAEQEKKKVEKEAEAEKSKETNLSTSSKK